MGGKSKSSSKQSSTAYNFNNVDYGAGGGSSGLAKNLNAVNSNIRTGSIFMSSTDHGATSQAGWTSRNAIAGNTAVASNALGTADRAIEASEFLVEMGLKDAANSRDFAESVFGDATGMISSATDRAYNDVADSRAETSELFSKAGAWIAGAFDRSAEEVAQANREALQFASQDVDRALKFAQMSTRSEAGQVTENMTKIVFLGVGGLAVLYFIAGRGK
jgi:predicted enzyme related to lactoylglutathione lyase